MEIGSFIEIEFGKGREYYSGNHVARLNSGRAGIYHAARVLGSGTVYLPYYQCDTVRDFLIKKHLQVRYYSINEEFKPLIETIPADAAIVIVNYYGIMSQQRLETLSHSFNNVIIDNSQAFFCKPIDRCLNVYSARKFIGVPDGAYVIGRNADSYMDEYEQDFSSDTCQFLLQRIEYGCEGKTYEARMLNEHRIDTADIKKMSKLTHSILDGTNYDFIVNKRRENFEIACHLFDGINKLDARMHYNDDCVPMVYPLVVENDGVLPKMLENKIFQGHWWSYLLNEVEKDSIEYWLSRYIIPITIDQRYGKEELKFTSNKMNDFLDGE
ncbi:MAG: hypothetical protein PHE51_06575 [Eubacteriales bacterium]|nr:hypothetical protein [Eubacteriales bacterium]